MNTFGSIIQPTTCPYDTPAPLVFYSQLIPFTVDACLWKELHSVSFISYRAQPYPAMEILLHIIPLALAHRLGSLKSLTQLLISFSDQSISLSRIPAGDLWDLLFSEPSDFWEQKTTPTQVLAATQFFKLLVGCTLLLFWTTCHSVLLFYIFRFAILVAQPREQCGETEQLFHHSHLP